jgi:RNA-directed DNA polymerase
MGSLEGKMAGTSCPETVSTKLQRIAELARSSPSMVLTTLAHHIDVEFLREAYRRTRKGGAVGVDGQTAEEFAKDLEGNLLSLRERLFDGTYFAPPVRRVHIPKGDGSKTRPIGVPTFADKVLQRAVAMVLEAVYEQDFRECSYGFRPGRSAHQALSTLWEELTKRRGGWVVELDIVSFFDALDPRHLRGFLDQRVRDGVLRRVIDKWLRAGVLEGGMEVHPELGTPQGGVVSPILANIYLHHVLDSWFEDDVCPRLLRRGLLVRYADDAVLVFESETDARRVFEVLPKRFHRYGLSLHPEKTRLIRFGKPRGTSGDRPGTFNLLGFTHYWGKSRMGRWRVKRKTARDRFSRALKQISLWCRRYRHLPVAQQHASLKRKLQGHYAYYGITGNMDALSRFRTLVERAWQKWLHRRSQRARMFWAKFRVLRGRYPLPPARVVHSVYRHAAKPVI